MEAVIIVVHLIVVLALIAVVLLQRSEGGALGIGGGGGGGGGGFMTSRGTANILTRATAILAAAFFGTSIALTVLARLDAPPSSILDEGPSEPAAPGAPAGGSILDQIRGQEPSEGNEPAPPLSTLPVPGGAPAADAPSAPAGTSPAPPIGAAPAPTDTTSPIGPQVPSPQQ